MTFDLAAMIADRDAGTPGEWTAEEKPGQLSDHGSRASIGLWAQDRWDRAYENDPDDMDAVHDAAWFCGIWGQLTGEDRANARRIARVPAMEAEIIRLTARVAEYDRVCADLVAHWDSTDWVNKPHTGEKIAAIRAALAGAK